MMQARKATMQDIPFIVSLARASYPQYPLEHGEAFVQRIIAHPNAAMMVCGEAVATVSAQAEFWAPNALVADVLPMFGHPSKDNPLGTYKALVAASDWAKDLGCYGIRFGSSVGAHSADSRRNGVDLMETFARRMGAYPWGVTYMKEFEQCHRQFQ